MNVKVFYDLWEMECCGKPFKIGDKIKWLVSPADNIRETIEIDDLKYIYDYHNDDWSNIFELEGIVKEIYIYYEEFELKNAPGHNILIPIKGTAKMIKTDSSIILEGQEYLGSLEASGYVVILEKVVTKQKNK